jgi:hypothetical protein
MHKYRDEKWEETEICKEGWFVSHRKEIGQETIKKIIRYEEKLKKLNRGEYHWLQRDQISYIYKHSSTDSNEKWKEHWEEKIRLKCPYIRKNKKPEKEFIYPQQKDLLEEKQISKSEENIIREDDWNKKKVNQVSMGKNTLQEFRYSRDNTFNDAYPTPKNLLVTVLKLNCIILNRSEVKADVEQII